MPTPANGTRTATLVMYQWSTLAPTTFPSGTSTYTWATGAFSAPATPNGWLTYPDLPWMGKLLWMVEQVYSDQLTDLTTVVTWSATLASAIGYAGNDGTTGTTGTTGTNGTNGTDGTNGQRTAVLTMYKWAATTPTLFPTGTSTYTWATGTFTSPGTPNSWTLTPGSPTAGFTLYETQQIYTDILTTATSSVTWTASVASPIGYAGSVGADTYQSDWNASTNTPTLASGVGTKGFYYEVSVAGTTNLDGYNSWNIGDRATFNGTLWEFMPGTASAGAASPYVLGSDSVTGVTQKLINAIQMAAKTYTSVSGTLGTSAGDNCTVTVYNGVTLLATLSNTGTPAYVTTTGFTLASPANISFYLTGIASTTNAFVYGIEVQ